MDWFGLLQPWKWLEYFMKWYEQFQRARRAKAETKDFESEHHTREKEREVRNFEADVQRMIQKIQQLRANDAAKFPGKNIYSEIRPGPDDDLNVFNEAMRRIRRDSSRKT